MCVIGLFCNSSMSPSGDRALGVETMCWINAGVNNAEITLTHHTTALPPPVTGHSPVTAAAVSPLNMDGSDTKVH